MREHQIVITLKPDQFLEVQRLSRAANAKSMGAFVRQKLLAALGIEGVLKAEDAEAIDVEKVLVDLQRLHSELKGFVAESLSPYSTDAFVIEAPIDADSQQLNLFEEEQPENALEAPPDVPVQIDNLETAAERAFAISPRLGEIGEELPAAEIAPVSEVSEQVNTRSAPEFIARHETHSRRDVHRYNHPHAASEYMDVPFANEQQMPATQERSSEPLASAASIEQPTAMADLGETVTKSTLPEPQVDPLSKLLSTEELSSRPVKPRLEPQYDEEAFQVPLSIAERRRQLTNSESDEAAPPEPLSPSAAAVIAAQDAQNYTGTAPSPAPIITDSSISDSGSTVQVDESSPASAPSTNNDPPGEFGRPLGYPPLSGSPPPKRRQV